MLPEKREEKRKVYSALERRRGRDGSAWLTSPFEAAARETMYMFLFVKFSVISREQGYRKSMRNTSRRIRARLLETENTPCSYVLTSNHRPHSPRFYFLLGNNHVAPPTSPPPPLSYTILSVYRYSSFPVFHRVIGPNHVSHPSLHTFHLRSLRGANAVGTRARFHVKTRNLLAYTFHYTMEKQATGFCA